MNLPGGRAVAPPGAGGTDSVVSVNDIEAISPVGRRIHVVGASASGKSTLAMRLAAALDARFVDLCALDHQPGRVSLAETDPGKLDHWMREATGGERWVVAGSATSHSRRVFWDHLDAVIWLDLPMAHLLWRLLRRTWRRWRSRELLRGTNYERSVPQFLVWKKHESLLAWIAKRTKQYLQDIMGYYRAARRRNMLKYQSNPRWSHIRFVRLTSAREVEVFAAAVERAVGAEPRGGRR